MNPNRSKHIMDKIPPDVPVVVILTHLPNEQEYHKERFEIVTKSLTMARKYVGMNHYFTVWDNGSGDVLRRWLLEFNPDRLVLSNNVGVMNAMHRIFAMYHDSIVAYSNDDMVYYPNWLAEQIDILKHFPNVGTVSGCVTKYYTGKADNQTVAWAAKNTKHQIVETPLLWDIQHGRSIGKSTQEAVSLFSGKGMPLIEYQGKSAIIGGNHCQFVAYANRIGPFTHKTNQYMEPLFHNLDIRINDSGLLRLMTTTRKSRHIGNRLTEEDRSEINGLVDAIQT